jgi:hypothetical protein
MGCCSLLGMSCALPDTSRFSSCFLLARRALVGGPRKEYLGVLKSTIRALAGRPTVLACEPWRRYICWWGRGVDGFMWEWSRDRLETDLRLGWDGVEGLYNGPASKSRTLGFRHPTISRADCRMVRFTRLYSKSCFYQCWCGCLQAYATCISYCQPHRD